MYIFMTSISAKAWLASTCSPSSTTNLTSFPGDGATHKRGKCHSSFLLSFLLRRGESTSKFRGIVFLLEDASLAVNHDPSGGDILLGVGKVALAIQANEKSSVGELPGVHLNKRSIQKEDEILLARASGAVRERRLV